MRVNEFYNRFPYPLRPRPTDWAAPFRALREGGPRRILHAGCATGSQTRSLAYTFPEAEIVGVDFADAPLSLARRWLEEPQMRNVRFEKADLCEPLSHLGNFDLVLSYGVLHHIPEVDSAFANIRAVLRDERSPFIVFLYGKLGRSRIAQLQPALARWQALLPSLTEEERHAALWTAARSNGSFAGVRGAAKLALVHASTYWRQAWESSNADAYLHPFVRYYDLEDVFELLARHSMRFGGFVQRPSSEKVGYPLEEAAVLERFRITQWRTLPERDRMIIVDKLAAPREYEFYCFKG